MNSSDDDTGQADGCIRSDAAKLEILRQQLGIARDQQTDAAAALSVALGSIMDAWAALGRIAAAWREANGRVVWLQEEIERTQAGR